MSDADLQHAGTAISETITILSEYLKYRDWERLRVSALEENLLKKRSSVTTSNFLRAVRHRFFVDRSPLPSADLVALAVVADMPKASKTQILYPYICKADALVEQAVLRLVKPRLQGSFSSDLTKEGVVNFLREESSSHPELRSWAESLTERWARGFLSLLRNFGVMTPAPKNKLLTPRVRVETFTFFLLGLLDSGLSVSETLADKLWQLYMMAEREKENLLVEASAKGWLHYARAASILEVEPRYASLKEWLEHGLG